jgi:hypothetical protein
MSASWDKRQGTMRQSWRGLLVLSGFALISIASALGGEFDRLEGAQLASIAKGADVIRHQRLTLRELDQLPTAFKDTRAAFLFVKTSQKNLARLLVSPALRKPPNGDGPPVPVFVLERFDTFEPGRAGSRLAKGAGILLFDGFQVDLDAGQVVPDGQGGDLMFKKGDKDGPLIEAVGSAELYSPKSLLTPSVAEKGPSPGRAVLPGDFSGRFRLFADGRWSGLLELEVAADRLVSGRFRSEANGTSYPVTGEVQLDPTNKVVFKVKFPRSEQDYDAYLWTEGKNTLSGTFAMGEKSFGFCAVREGSKLGPAE